MDGTTEAVCAPVGLLVGRMLTDCAGQNLCKSLALGTERELAMWTMPAVHMMHYQCRPARSP